ncbi:MAG: thiamine pyrophosphate-dependent enzyme [Anaerosomatales bacterium]|nr:thiamine pyrophosphate-dependent enzyme [Anaerosomatales bacterium]
MTRITELPVEERVLPGNRACAGCGLGIGLRAVTKALEGRAVLTVPASCLTVLGGMYPVTSVRMPWVNCAFPSTAAVATGIAAGLRATGRGEELTVLAMAGDGGTADIGIQALSGAAERNDDLIYLCYDNEAYMNTGTQRSGSTPVGARTTTTWTGKRENPKDVPRIMEAHRVPYVAVTSAAFPTDVYDKVAKARSIRGLRYLHMHTPCPSGWGFDPALSVRLGKAAVECGVVILYEVERGAFRLTGRSAALAKAGGELKPVDEYLEAQSRFKGLDAQARAAIQAWVDERWTEALERHARGK